MNAAWVRSLSLLVVVVASLSGPSEAFGQGSVTVDRSLIDQRVDATSAHLLVSGHVNNSLSLDARDVVVRLYMPGPDARDASIWQEPIHRIPATSRSSFRFRIPLAEVARHKTFVVRVWEYRFEENNLGRVLAQAQEQDFPLLRAVTEAARRLTASRPDALAESFAGATGIGRVCLVEAVLRSAEPEALQYLIEQMLAEKEVADSALVQASALLARLASEPPPFPQSARWNPNGTPRADLSRLLTLLPRHKAVVPALVRVRYMGTGPGRTWAAETLASLHMGSPEQQLASGDDKAVAVLVGVYRELANRSPRNVQLRRALALGQLRDQRGFLILAALAAVCPPCIVAYRAQRRS